MINNAKINEAKRISENLLQYRIKLPFLKFVITITKNTGLYLKLILKSLKIDFLSLKFFRLCVCYNLRIFYKGLNRNQGYITDEFANRLLSSLPYTPVVGIYNDLTKEFGGHNSDRNIANTYGVVPQQPNLSWEDHLDKDGIVRTYACCDVILFTGRYEAANRIIGKQ